MSMSVLRDLCPLYNSFQSSPLLWLNSLVHLWCRSPMTLTNYLLIKTSATVSYYFGLSFYRLKALSVTRLLQGTYGIEAQSKFYPKSSVCFSSVFFLNSIIFCLMMIIFCCIFSKGRIILWSHIKKKSYKIFIWVMYWKGEKNPKGVEWGGHLFQ